MNMQYTLYTSEIIARDVSAEEYLEKYAEHRCEWVNGTVIKMSPIHIRHTMIVEYLLFLLKVYFEFKPIGRVIGEPFVMRLSSIQVQREPDLQIILNTNSHALTDTYMDGPADICVEVVSPGSVQIDHGEKFEEYEKGGVQEYWIIDPLRNECRFYRLNESGIYIPYGPNADGYYMTPLLPNFKLRVVTLWQKELPQPSQVFKAVEDMLHLEG